MSNGIKQGRDYTIKCISCGLVTTNPPFPEPSTSDRGFMSGIPCWTPCPRCNSDYARYTK